MSRLLKPAIIDDPRELVELVSEVIGDIISGGFLLDAAVGNDELGYFDLVAVNEDGEGVFFFINPSGGEAEYLGLLKCMRWYQENRYALQKLHTGRVAFGPSPSVFVVAPWYSGSMRKVLLNRGAGRITLLQYVCFQDGNDEKSLFIEKVGDSSEERTDADSLHIPGTSPTDLSRMQTVEADMYLRKFRREMGTDISNVSDEELFDLLK